MRCQASICRWSPFFGICVSKLIGAIGCTTKGAKVAVSATGCAAISFFQCASGPSPKLETMPMPVIQASRGASAIGGCFRVQPESDGCFAHIGRHRRIGEIENAESDGRVADRLAGPFDFRVCDGKTGTVVHELRGDRKTLSGFDEGAQFGFLDRGQERHAPKLVHGDHQPAGGLRHCFNQQYTRHQGIAGEMPFEDRIFGRYRRLAADAAIGEIDVDDAVDQLKVLETHLASCFLPARGRLQAPLAATRSSMRELRFLSTKYWSVVALPSLTSCVHCSSGSLIPNALSMANAISRKSRLSMPRSLMAWLSGVMESRGMSQVSAIILAMVSNVEDIGNSLSYLGFLRSDGQVAGPAR